MAGRKSDPNGEGQPVTPAEDALPAPDDSLAPTDAESLPPESDPDTSPTEQATPAPEPDPAPEPTVAAPWSTPAREVPPVTDEPATPDRHDDDKKGRSFAARALIALVLLLIGAGVGIWAAPRVAPMLPSGLAPVAAWMSPADNETQARLDALAAELDSRISAAEAQIAALPAEAELDTRIAAAVSEATAPTTTEITTLREDVAALDTTTMRQQLDALAASVAGQDAKLTTLTDQLASGATVDSSATEEAVARIDVYRAELDGLRAEVTQLGTQTSTLAARIDEVAATADRSIEAAREQVATIEADASDALGAAQSESDIAQLRAALAAGQPFDEVAERISATSPGPLPEGITDAATTGAPTLNALRESFPEAAHAAIRASIIASAGDGILARTGAFLNAQVASRSLTPQPGMTPDAILSRMDARLQNGELEAALAEAEGLPSEAIAAMSDWLASARLRLAAEAGLDALSTPTPAPDAD